MAFGILEPRTNVQPQGTSLLESPHGDQSTEIILVPQPSKSPNDPLNMSRLRKELLFGTLVLGACATGVLGPVLVPGFNIVAVDFGFASLTKVTLLNGALVMGLGVSSYLCSCLAVVYGKRLVYLFTTLLLVGSVTWAAVSQSYTSLVASRAVQGLGMGGFFAMAGTGSINDSFFVHQRGLRVGLWNFAVIVSVNVAPVISAQVISTLSWRWAFWILAILFGLVLVCVFFLLPETTFDRTTPTVATPSHPSYSEEVVAAGNVDKQQQDDKVASGGSSQYHVGSADEKRSAFQPLFGLGSFQIQNQRRVMCLCISPLETLRHPVVLWGCAMWSVVFTWSIIIGAVGSQIWEAPPYNMSAIGVGNLVGIAPTIESALGTILGGYFCDVASRWMAIRNQGIFEPEFRLVVMAPSLITMLIGTFGLGTALDKGMSVITCGVFLAFLNFGLGAGCTGIVAYSNDVCQKKTGEVFGIAMLTKSAFAFGLTFMLNDYLTNHGPKVFFFTWGSLTVGVSLLSIPMYIYGKRVRAWAQEKAIII